MKTAKKPTAQKPAAKIKPSKREFYDRVIERIKEAEKNGQGVYCVIDKGGSQDQCIGGLNAKDLAHSVMHLFNEVPQVESAFMAMKLGSLMKGL